MKKKKKKIYWYFLFCLMVSIVVFPISLSKMNNALLESGQITGVEIAKRYAARENSYIRQYEYILNTAEYQLRPENRPKNIANYMKNFLDMIRSAMRLENVELYGVIGGRIEAATQWEGDTGYGAKETEWYKGALDSGGSIYYTGVYTDARLHERVVTLSKQIAGTEEVVAVDVYANHLSKESVQGIPEGSYYYLSDAKGTLLNWYIGSDMEEKEVQEKYKETFAEIQQGIHDSYDSYITGIDGVKRGVYYYQFENGWYSVITIPYTELLAPTRQAWDTFLIVLVFLVAVLLISLFMDYRSNKKSELYNDIVGVLGNSYYALYMIHLKDHTYFMLKGSDYVRGRIEKKGNYNELLRVLEDIIEEDTYEEFVKTFSVENMRKLVKKRVRDFGGDFKRIFNGEYRWMHVQMVYDESLKTGSVVLCFKDVDDVKRQELARLELLQTSLASVDEMAKSKNAFFSNMSHDMRTPLNGIIGLSNLAVRDIGNEEKIRDTFRKIRNLSKQLLGLINDILEISKMEQGKLKLRKDKFNIRENMEELVSVFRMQAEEEKKIFETHISVEDEWILNDWERIQQIMNNLLSNAFKFTKPGGKITVEVSETKDLNSKFGKYQITVKDTGAGMSQEFLKKLFIPFERETRFGAAKVSGTGLGLPIVHDLVVRMDGTIDVTSQLGRGSTFEIMLPCEISEAVPAREKKEPKQKDREEMFCGKGRKALLAEDNEINMEIAAEVLGMFGFEVTRAWNGKEAAELFAESREGEYAVIIMDMQMPVMDGCEAARQIRKMRRNDAKTIPIIAATANAFSEDIALTKKAGMNAHISKPIDFEIFRKTIQELLENKEE